MTALAIPSSLPVISGESGLSRYLAAIHKFPMLSADEEAHCARRWRAAGDREAAYQLVTSHLRLAAKIALRYRGYGLPVADLISEANMGLMQAVKRFEPEKGFRLATYAVWWMKAAVQEYVLRSWSMVKIGTTPAQKKLFFNLRKLKVRIAARDGELSAEQIGEIADHLKVTRQDVVAMDERLRGDISLTAPAGDHERWSLEDRLADPGADPESLLCETEERTRRAGAVRRALARLTPRERDIIAGRYLNDTPETLGELGRKFGVSGERIRQIEIRALQKIKAAIDSRRDAPGPSITPRKARLQQIVNPAGTEFAMS